jgi:hypothetical protein
VSGLSAGITEHQTLITSPSFSLNAVSWEMELVIDLTIIIKSMPGWI